MRTYTAYLAHKEAPNEVFEEIDVQAKTLAEAREAASEVLEEEYSPNLFILEVSEMTSGIWTSRLAP